MSMKYKRDIQMKFDATWLFLSESLVYSFPLFINFFKNHDKECTLRKVKKFSKCSFKEIFSEHLTTSRCVWY